ncbi:hypothetical protein ACU4GI_33415 [Cupriavidus basilensis]
MNQVVLVVYRYLPGVPAELGVVRELFHGPSGPTALVEVRFRRRTCSRWVGVRHLEAVFAELTTGESHRETISGQCSAGATPLSVSALPATDLDAQPATRWMAKEGSRFLVSAVLRKDSQDVSIKLVHSIETAGTADSALGAFTRKVLAQYPGYSLLDTLVSPVPAACGFQANI